MIKHLAIDILYHGLEFYHREHGEGTEFTEFLLFQGLASALAFIPAFSLAAS